MSENDTINSDSDSDIFLDDSILNDNPNLKKTYQIQHISDNKFRFKYMGMFERTPVVPLGDFKFDDNIHCYLNNNFVTEEDMKKTVFLPMITLMMQKESKFMNLCMGIEFDKEISKEDIENIENNDNTDFTGTVFLAFLDDDRNIAEILKKKLIFPGSTKLIYFIVGELRNDKIKKLISE
jgi:hypothetical protein